MKTRRTIVNPVYRGDYTAQNRQLHRYQKKDLEEISNWWQEHLRVTMRDLPVEWLESAFSKLRLSDNGDSGAP